MERLSRIARKVLHRRPGPGHDAEVAVTDASALTVLQSAFRLHQAGRFQEALQQYKDAIEIDPTSDVAHNLLGALLCSLGQLAEGEACFRMAIDLNASNVEALNNLASSRKGQGDLPCAEALYLRTLELRPDLADAWNNLGLIYFTDGRLSNAERCFRRALDSNQQHAHAHNNLGAVLRRQGELVEGENEFRAAIAANPGLAEAWSGLGDALASRGLLDVAEVCCKKALELRPVFPDATNNLATIAKARGYHDDAVAFCHDVLRINPNHLGALNNLGHIAARQADFLRAELFYRRALGVDPRHAVTRFNLGSTLLMLGNYTEGFEFYESRFEALGSRSKLPPDIAQQITSRPRWRGESLAGKRLLIWAEQGLGDCIMMLRYLPQLAACSVASVIVVCPPALERLVAAMCCANEVVTFEQADAALKFDIHCPMMSLPNVLGTCAETLTGAVPYLNVPDSMIKAWRVRLLNPRPKVGITWAGSRSLEDDAARSIPLGQFEPLLSLDTVQFLSLQKGDASEDWRKTGQVDLSFIDECNDFLDTAALVVNLDLVISVDTAVAHLAAALGRPVWLLNRFGSEWRWGLEGERSPWYPAMTIFRQLAPGSWDDVIREVRHRATVHFSRNV